MRENRQLIEISGMLAAFTLLGIIAIWGGKVFYPFWLICAVIFLYQSLQVYPFTFRDEPKYVVIVEIVFYTICSPFYLLMSLYSLLIILVQMFVEIRRGEKDGDDGDE